MPNPISQWIPIEFMPRTGFHFPQTTRRGRQMQPSFSPASYTVTHIEPVTITLAVGAIAANGSTTVTGKQGLSLQSINLARTDFAHIFFTNISTSAPANTICSAPTIVVSSNQGQPPVGVLAPGQKYTNLSLQATATLTSIPGSSAGTLTITAVCLVIGTVTS